MLGTSAIKQDKREWLVVRVRGNLGVAIAITYNNSASKLAEVDGKQ